MAGDFQGSPFVGRAAELLAGAALTAPGLGRLLPRTQPAGPAGTWSPSWPGILR